MTGGQEIPGVGVEGAGRFRGPQRPVEFQAGGEGVWGCVGWASVCGVECGVCVGGGGM